MEKANKLYKKMTLRSLLLRNNSICLLIIMSFVFVCTQLGVIKISRSNTYCIFNFLKLKFNSNTQYNYDHHNIFCNRLSKNYIIFDNSKYKKSSRSNKNNPENTVYNSILALPCTLLLLIKTKVK